MELRAELASGRAGSPWMTRDKAPKPVFWYGDVLWW